MKLEGSGTELHEKRPEPSRAAGRPAPPKRAKRRARKLSIRDKIERGLECGDVRRFPLGGGTVYAPHYILNRTRNGRKIIVHVDERHPSSRGRAYGAFMKRFRDAYYLILIVDDGYLRAWNALDMNRRALFDEIWVAGDIDDLVRSVKNSSKRLDESPNYVTCSSCHKIAGGAKKIKRDFVYKTESDGTITVQPRCRECTRRAKSQKPKRAHKSCSRCVGCGISFRTAASSRLYCAACTVKLSR